MKRHQRFQMSDIPFHWFLLHFDFISFFIAGYLFFLLDFQVEQDPSISMD